MIRGCLCREPEGQPRFCYDRWGARGHLCSLDSEHDGGHECACGHRWREVDE